MNTISTRTKRRSSLIALLRASTAPSVIKTITVTLAAVTFCFATDLCAMIYRPEKGAMWDPSILWRDGKFYAFMMYNQQGHSELAAEHCLLATSSDGVHWQTDGVVNQERESAAGNKFFKCFVGRCGDRFIMDHGVARPGGQDVLRSYESTDLRHWDYLFSSSPDPRWYGLPPQPARWDHMYILPKEEDNPNAGYWGHVVAVPKPGDPPGVGMMESPDGRTWTVLPPASILWPSDMQACSHCRPVSLAAGNCQFPNACPDRHRLSWAPDHFVP